MVIRSLHASCEALANELRFDWRVQTACATPVRYSNCFNTTARLLVCFVSDFSVWSQPGILAVDSGIGRLTRLS